MTRFEEELGYVLQRFRHGETNYAEVTIEIEEAVLRELGFASAINKIIERTGQDIARDAARYRWLRDHAKEIVFPGPHDVVHCFDATYEKAPALDAAIDAAIAAKRGR